MSKGVDPFKVILSRVDSADLEGLTKRKFEDDASTTPKCKISFRWSSCAQFIPHEFFSKKESESLFSGQVPS